MKIKRFLIVVAAVFMGGAGILFLNGCSSTNDKGFPADESLKNSQVSYAISGKTTNKTTATNTTQTTNAIKTTILTKASTATNSASATNSTNTVVIPLNELRSQADEVLNPAKASTRDRLWVVFTLVDRLLEANQQEDAEKYIVKGLGQFPWNLTYQMVYAEMLAKKGEMEKAEQKASLVYKYAETDVLIQRAGKLLKKDPLPDFAEINTLPGTNHCVVLVPFPGCDKWLIVHIKDELSSTLNVPVYVQAINVKYPPPRRDLRGSIINGYRRKILENISDKIIVDVMKELKITKEELGDDNVLKIMKFVQRKAGGSAEAQLDAYLKDAIGKDNQWDANELLSVLIAGVNPFRRTNAAYIGIVPVDVYANYYNFLFGWGNNLGHIISYRRFSAVFNNETPNQDRLDKRMEMQCLASIGYVFGLPRCSDPTCARAYPNSLQEHDAKTGALCSECRNGFRKLFGQDK